MRLFSLLDKSFIRTVFVALLLVLVLFFICAGFVDTIYAYTMDDTSFLQNQLVRDKITPRSFRIPAPEATAFKRADSSKSHIEFALSNLDIADKKVRLFTTLVDLKLHIMHQMRFYMFYLLGVVFFLKKQSVICFLHKRDTTKEALCTF